MTKRPISERFYEKVDTATSTGSWGGIRCHEWTGFIAKKSGYGQISIDKRAHYVHRVAYEFANGPIPKGMQVCHRCDNRKCVNPEHLFLGTLQDNMEDMVSKLRQAHGPHCFHAKLTVEQVHEIRNSAEKQKPTSEKYGITQSVVSMIRSGKIWRHV